MDKIYIAKLGKAVGLQGHLRLIIDSDFPNQFKKNAKFITNKNIQLKVQEYNSSRELIKFENYDSMELARKLTNQQLFSSKEETKQNCHLEKDQYFWFDIIDCKIIENEQVLGKIVDIHRYPLDDYFEVKTEQNLVEKRLPTVFLVPYIMNEYIISVDISNKVIQTKQCLEILENS